MGQNQSTNETVLLYPIYRMRNKTTFEGDSDRILALSLYLAARHSNDCIPFDLKSGVTIAESRWQTFLKGKRLPEDFSLFLDTDACEWVGNLGEMWREIALCIENGSRFVILPFIFGNNDDLHMNMLISDTNLKTVERFEPHGTNAYSWLKSDACDVDTVLTNLLHSGPLSDYKYISPLEFCPWLGPQSAQERELDFLQVRKGKVSGFCVAWSFWYADLRLRYPDILPSDLIDRAIRETKNDKGKTLTQYITAFASFFEQLQPFLRDPDYLPLVMQHLNA